VAHLFQIPGHGVEHLPVFLFAGGIVEPGKGEKKPAEFLGLALFPDGFGIGLQQRLHAGFAHGQAAGVLFQLAVQQ